MAVVSQIGADDDLIGRVGDHQAEGDQEIAVGKGNLKGSPERNILLFVLRRSLHALGAGRVSIEQDKYGDDRVARGHQDPRQLLVGDHAGNIVDQREGERGDNHARGDGQHHADVADGVAVAAVAGHQRAERVERLADRGVNHRVHQVIGDKCVDDFTRIAEVRHGEQQYRCHRIREREAQDPDTGLAVFGMRAVDDRTHCNVRKAVEDTGDQHNHTDSAG